MNLIAIYLSCVEWYDIVSVLRLLDEPYAAISRHILDEIGRASGIAPEFFEPQHNTCEECENYEVCEIITGKPCCPDFIKKD